MTDHKLDLYLRKCELQWRADHSDGLESVDWLAPYCNSAEEIAAYLRELGFRVKRIVNEELFGGEQHRWVITTSGVIVYVNNEYCKGAFGKEYRG